MTIKPLSNLYQLQKGVSKWERMETNPILKTSASKVKMTLTFFFSADRSNFSLMGRFHPSLIITVNEVREVPHVCWYNLNIWTQQFMLDVWFYSPWNSLEPCKERQNHLLISYQMFYQNCGKIIDLNTGVELLG